MLIVLKILFSKVQLSHKSTILKQKKDLKRSKCQSNLPIRGVYNLPGLTKIKEVTQLQVVTNSNSSNSSSNI